MSDLRFYVFLKCILVMSGRWDGDNESMCAVEPCLGLEKFPPIAGLGPATTKYE